MPTQGPFFSPGQDNPATIAPADITSFVELAQDAVGAMVGTGLTYNDATPSLTTDWTYLILSSDQTTTSNVAATIPGFTFTPAASKIYEIEVRAVVASSVATEAINFGFSDASGATWVANKIFNPTSATADVLRNGTFAQTASTAWVGANTKAI